MAAQQQSIALMESRRWWREWLHCAAKGLAQRGGISSRPGL
jgi:hypothetical protein